MAKGIQDFQVKESLSPALKAVDANTNGTNAFDPTRAIHVSTAATYRLYFSSDSASSFDMYLNDGATYPYSLVKITTTGDAAVTANHVTLLY
jgi:hypothetical protein|tara:strand:+ start:292 stop:567 length:276 start_codon:yes stop_codon:yes gene_type:complete